MCSGQAKEPSNKGLSRSNLELRSLEQHEFVVDTFQFKISKERYFSGRARELLCSRVWLEKKGTTRRDISDPEK